MKRNKPTSFKKSEKKFGDKKSKSSFDGKKRKSKYSSDFDEDRKEGKRSYGNKFGDKKKYSSDFNEDRKEGKRSYGNKFGDKKKYSSDFNEDRKEGKRSYGNKFGDKKKYSSDFNEDRKEGKRSYGNKFGSKDNFFKKERSDNNGYKKGSKKQQSNNADKKDDDGLIRLNKFISNSGICSRREADELIEAGVVKVNGKTITTLGYKVSPTDVINVEGQVIKNEKKVYLLLNKPKDYLTTTKDPQNRKTVMELVADACKERIFPVGRLDRNTTGLLLFTNDGELADKLMHPSSNIAKLYHVSLNRNFSVPDFEKLSEGIELEDGNIKPDALSYVEGKKNEIGIEIHSGRNRIVRRIFEYLDYNVVRLDRVIYAGLTKKNLPRAKWRFLTEKEVAFLKMI